jgi:hypothetical protein
VALGEGSSAKPDLNHAQRTEMSDMQSDRRAAQAAMLGHSCGGLRQALAASTPIHSTRAVIAAASNLRKSICRY